MNIFLIKGLIFVSGPVAQSLFLQELPILQRYNDGNLK